MSRKPWPLAALATVALIGAGCSNGSSENGNTGTGSSGGNNTTNRAKTLKFAECMRENGVSDFPDPNGSGELTIDAIANGSAVDPSTAAFKRAVDACKDLEPPGFMGRKRTDQEQKNALDFAQCIRDNGVRDFPDPVNGQPLVDTNRIPSSATNGGMTILNAAMQKCRDLSAKAGARGK